MRPADISCTNDDLSSQDSSVENEDAPSSPRRRRSYCSKCDSGSSHSHQQSDTDSPRLIVHSMSNSNPNTINNSKNINNNNSDPTNSNTTTPSINNNNSNNISGTVRSEIKVTAEGNDGGAAEDDTQGRPGKQTAVRGEGAERDADSPSDMDLTEAITIPEVGPRRSVTEVLSRVVKLQRSRSSSSASELATRTPDAPDIVASTTGRGREASGGASCSASRGTTTTGPHSTEVATLVLLCQHYARLVHALKEENYLLSCTNSPLLSTPQHARTSRGRSPKNVFTWDSDAIQNFEQYRQVNSGEDRRPGATKHSSAASDLRVPGSPNSIKFYRSSSSTRDYYNNNNNNNNNATPAQSPARAREDDILYPNSSSEVPGKDKKSWNLKPQRTPTGRHKKETKSHRKCSFSFFKDSSKLEDQDAENGNESPKSVRSGGSGAGTLSPTVGVLSSRISHMEDKIEEILKQDNIGIMLRETEDRSPARCERSLRSSSIRRVAGGQRGYFYRHSVRDSRRDQEGGEEGASEDGCGRRGGGGGACQYQTLAQAAHVEVDKLRQLVQLLNTRLTEMSGRMVEAETRLREEQQRAAVMERYVERHTLESRGDSYGGRGKEQASRGSSEGSGSRRRHGSASYTAWGDRSTESLLRSKLDMAREEIELLRQHIDLLLRMRQEDLRVYESTVDKLRHSLTSGSQW